LTFKDKPKLPAPPLRNPTELESKGIFLEETLEKLQNHSDSLYKKLKRLERNKNTPKETLEEIRTKLKSVNDGVWEVYNKANILWRSL
jgi:hypothetical protein